MPFLYSHRSFASTLSNPPANFIAHIRQYRDLTGTLQGTVVPLAGSGKNRPERRTKTNRLGDCLKNSSCPRGPDDCATTCRAAALTMRCAVLERNVHVYLSGSKPRMHNFEAVWWNSCSRFKHCAMHSAARKPDARLSNKEVTGPSPPRLRASLPVHRRSSF